MSAMVFPIASAARKAQRASGPSVERALVTGVGDGVVTVALADGREVQATFALALPYAACEGDVLLVIDPGSEEVFVIGVIAGTGKTSLELQGNVALRAVGGQLQLAGDEGVRVEGPSVEVRTDTLRTVARSIVETTRSLFQRVAEVLHVHAHNQVTIVDEGSYSQAKTTAIQSADTVTINGKEIHLG
jgi:hypothetical protein